MKVGTPASVFRGRNGRHAAPPREPVAAACPAINWSDQGDGAEWIIVLSLMAWRIVSSRAVLRHVRTLPGSPPGMVPGVRIGW
jgi:hypothetical protein